MRNSSERILTTHVGSLPAPPDLWSLDGVNLARLQDAVVDVVGQQRDCGVDLVNEGELTKGGNWLAFVNERLTGFERAAPGPSAALLTASADWKEFDAFYKAALEGGTLFEQTRSAAPQTRAGSMDWACTGPISYRGEAALAREIDSLRRALGTLPLNDAFLTSTAPASLEPSRDNRYYRTQEEFVYALADAMSVEYRAIAEAGLLVQVDDAWLAALWDRIGVQMGLESYRRYCAMRVEALNHALRGIPAAQVRYHLCWGSWHGPHAHDLPMADIVEIMLKVNAQTYLFEAANVRHEHEYVVWKSVKLPEDKILAPGVVSHATTLIEHPELVAERIRRFADIVGRERVIASTDCGLGLRCHPQIAWAKLRALSRGAALASQSLWRRSSVA
jgi:5-methyltetrahydropteroyltriglutamate--homocysteine methyltransferase